MGAPQSVTSPGHETLSGGDDDDEYEYEYDENETEHHYFTLDLSTRTRRRKDHGAEHIHLTPNSGHGTSNLQILDLHTSNPLIKLNNDFYSCTWSTDLGTQLYLTRPGLASTPQHAGNVLDVAALSRARLIGRPAKLRGRHADHEQTTSDGLSGSSASHAIAVDDANAAATEDEVQETDPSVERQIARFAAVRKTSRIPAHRTQASFLERLSTVKRKRGEHDLVPFFGVKQYASPENKDAIREAAKSAEAMLKLRENTIPKEPTPKKKRKSAAVEVSNEAEQESRSVQPNDVEVSTTAAATRSGTGTPNEDRTGASMMMIDPLLLDNTPPHHPADHEFTTGGTSDPT